MSLLHYPTFTSKCKSFFSALPRTFSDVSWLAWPPQIPYNAWQNSLKKHLQDISSRLSIRLKKDKQSPLSQQEIVVENQLETIVETLKVQKSTKNIKLSLITLMKQFLDRKNLAQHIDEVISDQRDQSLIKYSKYSIISSCLTILLSRMGCGHKFTIISHDDDEKYSRANIAKFIDAPEGHVPVIKTIERFLANLEEDSINKLMIAFFKDLQKSKFFTQHPQIMLGDFFTLAVDCVHTHTYDHPHHRDELGNNDCPYCLKRVYHRDTSKECVRWLHQSLVFSFVFRGGLKIPVYSYPIHAKQVNNLESVSEDEYKQECELIGLKTALPILRDAFPKMNIMLLLDGLYANRPVIKLAQEHRCGYIIVRKEACLPLLAKECDANAMHPHHKNCTKICQKVYEGWKIEQKYEWFNGKYLGEEATTNVLRFYEERTSKKGVIKIYEGEWLCSERISRNSCESIAMCARSRWEIEDVFNTLKNRGYNLEHDYSRNPRSLFIWQCLSLFAFGIFELFRFSEAVKKRGNWPQKTLAEKILWQLTGKPTEEIFSEQCLSQRVQFRYYFVIDIVLPVERYRKAEIKALTLF